MPKTYTNYYSLIIETVYTFSLSVMRYRCPLLYRVGSSGQNGSKINGKISCPLSNNNNRWLTNIIEINAIKLTKNIKHLGFNLIKYAQDLYRNNLKIIINNIAEYE